MKQDLNLTAVFTEIPELISSDRGFAEIKLEQNYPNPFSEETEIIFTLPEAGIALLTVLTMEGQPVATPVNGVYNKGTHHIRIERNNLVPGIYLYTLKFRDYTVYKQMLVR
jgi:hypothetical protein